MLHVGQSFDTLFYEQKDHAKTVSPEINNPQAPAPTEASDQTAAVCSPGRPLVPEHLDERHSSCSVPNQRSGCPQFAAQAISIKKLEPNLVRLFISDNSEKAEYTVNTKAVLGKGSFGKVFKVSCVFIVCFSIDQITANIARFVDEFYFKIYRAVLFYFNFISKSVWFHDRKIIR